MFLFLLGCCITWLTFVYYNLPKNVWRLFLDLMRRVGLQRLDGSVRHVGSSAVQNLFICEERSLNLEWLYKYLKVPSVFSVGSYELHFGFERPFYCA